jgi:hypothetical protein
MNINDLTPERVEALRKAFPELFAAPQGQERERPPEVLSERERYLRARMAKMEQKMGDGRGKIISIA